MMLARRHSDPVMRCVLCESTTVAAYHVLATDADALNVTPWSAWTTNYVAWKSVEFNVPWDDWKTIGHFRYDALQAPKRKPKKGWSVRGHQFHLSLGVCIKPMRKSAKLPGG